MKFWQDDNGWGGIEGPDLLGDVWVHFSAIEMDGYHSLEVGQRVQVTYTRQDQESWKYVAETVRPVPR